MLKKVVFLLVAVTFTIFEQVRSADPPRNQHVTAALYAGSLLLGTQLGVKKGAAEGKVPSSVASCLLALEVLDSESARRVFDARIRALANSCGAGWR